MTESTVVVDGLEKSFGGSGLLQRWAPKVPALDGLSFRLEKGELAALVGESGSGKTTIGRCLLGLVDFDAGSVRVNGYDIGTLKKADEKAFRMSAQMVFQNPYSSLNPAFRAREALVEAVRVHDPSVSRERAREEVERLAAMVQLPVERLNEYPPSLSGGEKRRVVFARALATRPQFVVTDEPVSGLDQPIQAQLLDLLRKIHQRQQSTMLFISHDLRLVRFIATRVIVLHRGRIVEDAPADIFFKRSAHPYSQELLESAFYPDRQRFPQSQKSPPARGAAGCSFRNRCNFALVERNTPCGAVTPQLTEIEPGHRVACHWCGKGPQ
jgi:oligopeptide/dipeptide ABC transporter ATP-binding protein